MMGNDRTLAHVKVVARDTCKMALLVFEFEKSIATTHQFTINPHGWLAYQT
jgi:hypothetical protein